MTFLHDDTPWERRSEILKAAEDADQAELRAIETGAAPVDAGIEDDVIADVHHADDSDFNYTWDQEDDARESITGRAIEIIDERARQLGELYPFARHGAELKYKRAAHAAKKGTNVYELCLALSLLRDYSTAPFNRGPIVFERLAAEVARLYLGKRARSMRTGWPTHDQNERPTMFDALGRRLEEFTGGNLKWAPMPPHDEASRISAVRDEGLDFVTWLPFDDSRYGAAMLFGQCACGRDWPDKFQDLPSGHERLLTWFRPLGYVPPIRVFAIPYDIPGRHVFGHVSRQAGLTFDRIRLTALAGREAAEFNRQLLEDIDSALQSIAPWRDLIGRSKPGAGRAGGRRARETSA